MRARRAIMLGVLCILGGAVVSVTVAEGIGVSGVVHTDLSVLRRYVSVGGRCVQAHDWSGTGWRQLGWRVMDERVAALTQYRTEPGLHIPEDWNAPPRVRFDPPGSLPSWSRLWRPEHWPPDSFVQGYRVGGSEGEIGVGWPLPSFSMDWDDSPSRAIRGGKRILVSQSASPRVLLWRPIPLGLAVDTLVYAVALAGIVGVVKLGVRVRRRRRCACPACGYDLRGLAAVAVCPECGGTAKTGPSST